MTLRMIVAATNAMGEPDLYFLKVSCTQEQYDNGDHYDAAKEQAEEEGYEKPMIAFDENDSGGQAMLPLFVWESASVVEAEI